MPLLTLADVTIKYGATTILEDVSFTVEKGDRWGVVGRNGAGKTSLFRVVTRETSPAHGTADRLPGLHVALLDQYRDFGPASTVWDAAAAGYRELMALGRKLEQLTDRLAAAGHSATPADVAQYGRVQEQFQHQGGYDFHARVDAVLQGLAFDPDEARTRSVDTLSGGERGRVGLAAQLAAPAHLRLLDEPTNHLDLETTRWLTAYVRDYGETIMVISHDRAFLDECADHVLACTREQRWHIGAGIRILSGSARSAS